MTVAKILYLINLVENVDFCMNTGSLFILMGAAVVGGFSVMKDSVEGECDYKLFNWFRSKLWIGVLLLSISCFIPGKSTMYLMLGSSYLQQSNLPTKVSQALELKLDDVIDELKHKGKKKDE